MAEPNSETRVTTADRLTRGPKPETARWMLAALLKAIGGVLCLAFLCLGLPETWMAATHQGLGLGEFPAATITRYLARSACMLYGMHGVLLLVVARDVRRYSSLVTAVGALHLAMGAVMVPVDLTSGMPWYWTLLEGPPIMVGGLLILGLQHWSRT